MSIEPSNLQSLTPGDQLLVSATFDYTLQSHDEGEIRMWMTIEKNGLTNFNPLLVKKGSGTVVVGGWVTVPMIPNGSIDGVLYPIRQTNQTNQCPLEHVEVATFTTASPDSTPTPMPTPTPLPIPTATAIPTPTPIPPVSGARIAFASDRTGNYSIYTMNSDGTDEIRLTIDNDWNDFPSWSPDGTKIGRSTP
jgi:hypothetical protein